MSILPDGMNYIKKNKDGYSSKDEGCGYISIKNGLVHAESIPAKVTEEYIAWMKNGILHREDGPAIEYANGDKHWYRNGKIHREGGPAIESNNSGIKEYWINGKMHREDGPAFEDNIGNKFWYKNGKLHREDGPAVEHGNGYKEIWLNGKQVSEVENNITKRKTSLLK